MPYKIINLILFFVGILQVLKFEFLKFRILELSACIFRKRRIKIRRKMRTRKMLMVGWFLMVTSQMMRVLIMRKM